MTRLAILALLALATAAQAHSWYPWECCSDHDCQRVKCEDIAEVDGGFRYDGVTFMRSAEKPSQDRYCHVCILGQGDARRGLCLFTLQGS